MDERQRQLWLKELRLNGFVILRDFLDRDWVESVHEQLLPILRGELERTQKGDSTTERSSCRLAFDLNRYVKLLQGPLADDRYRNNAIVEELVGEYLGGAGWDRGWSQVECVWNGAAYMKWHSDQTLDETLDAEAPNTPVRVTYNIPLVDFTWSNGAMEILPGTHLHSRNFLNAPFAELAHVFPARLRLQRGDALLRDGNGLHRGTPNLTDTPRPMLDQTYRRKRG